MIDFAPSAVGLYNVVGASAGQEQLHHNPVQTAINLLRPSCVDHCNITSNERKTAVAAAAIGD